MNYKSYLVEENIKSLKNKIFLFYGENEGLKKDFKTKIKSVNQKAIINNLTQDEILKNEHKLFEKVFNASLFGEEEIFFIEQVNDKILELIKELEIKIQNQKIYFFAQILDKKSKLRSHFEKSKNLGIVACYKDNELNLKKIILKKLSGYDGLIPENINLIINNCNLDRIKLNNELDKIQIYFNNKKIVKLELEKLLNQTDNEDFDEIRDSAFSGNKDKINKLLSDTFFSEDKIFFYLNNFNQRLFKLKEIYKFDIPIEKAIDNLKPPIFWKDKPNIIMQAKKWNLNKVQILLKKIFDIEILMKRISIINRSAIIKKLVIEVCDLANS